MTKRKTQPATRIPAVTMADLDRAVDELEISVPIYEARLVGGRLELRLYGGAVAYWPPLPADVRAHGDAPQGDAPQEDPCPHD